MKTALHYALEKGFFTISEYFLLAKMELKDESLVISAVIGRNISFLKILIDNGMDIDTVDESFFLVYLKLKLVLFMDSYSSCS